MITLQEIAESCRAEAIAGRLSPTELSNWRYFCREYSKTFHTPLHEVLVMSPEKVILAYFEEQLDKKRLGEAEDFESIVTEVRRIEDPDYDEHREKEMDDFVAGIEAWEENRIKTGAPIPTPKRKKVASAPEPKVEEKEPEMEQPPADLPKSGFVDFSRFSKDEES
jgi:hypothetical protein